MTETAGREFRCPTCKKDWREFSEDNLRENKIQEARLLLSAGHSRRAIERSLHYGHSVVREAFSRYGDEIAHKSHPVCLTCCRLMWSHGPQFYRCEKCGYNVSKHLISRASIESNIEKMIRSSCSVREICSLLRVDPRTVSRIRGRLSDLPACLCGKPLQHNGRCETVQSRGIKRLNAQRTFFDTLLVRLNRAVPHDLPVEMRADVQQDMLLDVLKSTNEIISSVKKYIKSYYHLYPQRRNSLDDPYSEASRRFGDNPQRLAS